jgi:hypothetical protein
MIQPKSRLHLSRIEEDTYLYRYMSISQFLSLVEGRQLHLAKITSWDDTWEGALYKVPTQIEDGEIHLPSHSMGDDMFGQCWSLFKDSDAMWRIYSPNCEGIMIRTTAKKFCSISLPPISVLGRVYYGTHLPYPNDVSTFDPALLKREAFEHEQEVRLLVLLETDTDAIHVGIDVFDFIEEIIIDPRASDWFVKTIQNYCKRIGFKISAEKSSLYDFDPTKVGYVRRFLRVYEENGDN